MIILLYIILRSIKQLEDFNFTVNFAAELMFGIWLQYSLIVM